MTFSKAVRAVGKTMAERWRVLFLTDVLFKALAFLVLAPLATGLLRLCLWASGSGTLADADIVFFFAKPLGWAVLVAFGAVSIGIVALEQATLLVLLMSPHGGRLSMGAAIGWATTRIRKIVTLTGLFVALTAVVIAPFLIAAGVIAWATLGEYDINYYLAERPPIFQMAVWCGVGLIALLGGVLAWLASGWSLALPLVIFEAHGAREALAESRRRVAGSRRLVVALIVAWALASVLASSCTTSAVVFVARQLVPLTVGGLPRLVAAIGATLVVWFAAGLAVNLFATTSFAAMLAETYRRLSPVESLQATAALPASGPEGVSLGASLTRRRVVALLSVGCLLVAGVGAVAARQVRFEDDVAVMGHRGAGGLAPENTLAAIDRAIESNADWVEVDVQETSDGEVVVVHDSDFMKLAGVNLKVCDATLADMEAVDVGKRFDSSFTGERVPTLTQVLERCRGKVGVNIELKDYGHGQRLEERVAKIVEDCSMQQEVILMSLKPAVVKRMKSLRPGWKVGLLMSVAVGDPSKLEADFLAVNARFAGHGFVDRVHRAGKQVYVWTTNDAVSISQMIGRGVDGVITDYPDLARTVLAQRATLSPVERILLELAAVLGVKSSVAPQ
jgi:glycerophosphoryl diester phosphodiesterase